MSANSQFAIAVHVLTVLAGYEGEKVKSEYIAESVNTNPVVIRRLICNLRDAGLVVSQVGPSGGNTLARRPDMIRLSDVYKAVTPGETFVLPSKKANQKCPIGRGIGKILCSLQGEVDKSIEGSLKKHTLRDVLSRALKV